MSHVKILIQWLLACHLSWICFQFLFFTIGALAVLRRQGASTYWLVTRQLCTNQALKLGKWWRQMSSNKISGTSKIILYHEKKKQWKRKYKYCFCISFVFLPKEKLLVRIEKPIVTLVMAYRRETCKHLEDTVTADVRQPFLFITDATHSLHCSRCLWFPLKTGCHHQQRKCNESGP